ncbi:hypothetical protein [Actinoplanes sp. NPDC051851]|uniref:hypothetical protein n=1 Tax=Actinoplanes sp. NPDC051851 TaxID=3154753 RepID=UPI003448FFD8
MSRRRERRPAAPPAPPQHPTTVAPPAGRGRRLRHAAAFLASTVAVAVIGAVSGRLVNDYQPSHAAPQGPAVAAFIDTEEYPPDGTQLIIPGEIEQDQIPTSYTAAHSWAQSQGGTETLSYLDVTLEGRRSPSVVIRQIRATVLSRQTAVPGSLLRFAGSEGETETIDLAFDLGETVPVARHNDPETGPGKPYFAGHFITLGLGEQIVLKVEVHPAPALCTWRLDLDVVAGTTPQTITLPADGRTFRTTPEQPSYQAAYDIGPGDQVRAASEGP